MITYRISDEDVTDLKRVVVGCNGCQDTFVFGNDGISVDCMLWGDVVARGLLFHRRCAPELVELHPAYPGDVANWLVRMGGWRGIKGEVVSAMLVAAPDAKVSVLTTRHPRMQALIEGGS